MKLKIILLASVLGNTVHESFASKEKVNQPEIDWLQDLATFKTLAPSARVQEMLQALAQLKGEKRHSATLDVISADNLQKQQAEISKTERKLRALEKEASVFAHKYPSRTAELKTINAEIKRLEASFNNARESNLWDSLCAARYEAQNMRADFTNLLITNLSHEKIQKIKAARSELERLKNIRHKTGLIYNEYYSERQAYTQKQYEERNRIFCLNLEAREKEHREKALIEAKLREQVLRTTAGKLVATALEAAQQELAEAAGIMNINIDNN